MIFGPDLFTAFHSALSLAALVAGVFVLLAFLRGEASRFWETAFLITAIATSVTGFGFKVDRLLPSHVVGAISLLALAAAVWARYGAKLSGAWRWIYVACVMFAFYLDAFVGVVQAFGKIGALQALAPTQSEAPFVIAQALALIAFVIAGVLAVRRFRPALPA